MTVIAALISAPYGAIGTIVAMDLASVAGSSADADAQAVNDASPPAGEVTVSPAAAASPAGNAAAAPANASTSTKASGVAHSRKKASARSAVASTAPAKPAKDDSANSPASSSPFAVMSSPNSGPIKIKSDSLSVDYKKNSALWVGHVYAVRADGDLSSDTLQVIYGKDFHDLQQMIASGNVRISRGTQYSNSDRAVFNQANQTVVLTGNPIVHDGTDQITGNKITVYLKTGESVVEGAKAVIFPRQAKTRDNGAKADHTK